MARVVDELITRVDVENLSTWSSGIGGMARQLGLIDSATVKSAGTSVAWGLAAAGAAGMIAKWLGGAAMAAGEEDAAFQRAALSFKGGFPSDEIEKFSGQMRALTGIGDEENAKFLGLLGTFGLTAVEAKKMAVPILDAAQALKAAGISSESLSMQVGRAIGGGMVVGLRRAGIMVDAEAFKIADRAGRVAMLAAAIEAKAPGAAAAYKSTLPGAIEASTTAFRELREALGAPLVGPLTTVAKLVGNVADAIGAMPKPIMTVAAYIGVGLVPALLGVTVAMGREVLVLGQLAKAHLVAAEAATAQAAAEKLLGAGWVWGAQAAQANAAAQIGAGASRFGMGRLSWGAIGNAALVVGGGELAKAAIGGDSGWARAGRIGLGMGEGALAGYMVGNLPGAAIGAVAGLGLAGWQEHARNNQAPEATTKTETLLGQAVAELKKQTASITDLARGKLPFGTNDVPAAYQIGLLGKALA